MQNILHVPFLVPVTVSVSFDYDVFMQDFGDDGIYGTSDDWGPNLIKGNLLGSSFVLALDEDKIIWQQYDTIYLVSF